MPSLVWLLISIFPLSTLLFCAKEEKKPEVKKKNGPVAKTVTPSPARAEPSPNRNSDSVSRNVSTSTTQVDRTQSFMESAQKPIIANKKKKTSKKSASVASTQHSITDSTQGTVIQSVHVNVSGEPITVGPANLTFPSTEISYHTEGV